MSPEEFPTTFLLVLVVFGVEMVLVQAVAFRALATAGMDPIRRSSRHVRDHVVSALVRAGLLGLPVTVLGTVVWMMAGGRRSASAALWGAEFFLASLVLSLGLAALAVRISLHALDRGQGSGRVLLVRGAFLGAGALYALAVWARGTASPGEHLLAFFIRGVALLVLGLNRLGGIQVAVLARLGGGRDEPGLPRSG